jgi:hypothetical protein
MIVTRSETGGDVGSIDHELFAERNVPLETVFLAASYMARFDMSCRY